MTTPLILAYVGMAVMLTLSCTGSAIGVTMGQHHYSRSQKET